MRSSKSTYSISAKISFSFYLLLLVIIGTVLLTYGIVWQVEQQVEQVTVIDDFFNLTLELRRFEKNYFLYQQEKDYEENTLYHQQLTEILQEKGAVFSPLTSKAAVERTCQTLEQYGRYILQLHPLRNSSPGSQTQKQWQEVQNLIRANGKDLTEFAEKTSQLQKQSIHLLLRTTRLVLLVSICLLILLSIALATFLARRVVQSLKQLEGYTKKIAIGEVIDIPTEGAEEEILSIIQAFNRMTQDLHLRQKQLVHSEKLAALGTLLAGVAHELNNPLSNISTSAQILAEEISELDLEYKKDLVGQIEEQADKARDIVKTLLEFSRIRAFEKQKLLLKPLLSETIRLLGGKARSLIEIKVEMAGDLTISADKQRIQQVFLNLIKNALDALQEEGTICISARSAIQAAGLEEVEIMIEDNGPGIAPDDLKRIFDPFFTTKDVGQGSGLGLFVVHDIIEAHGGTITVESEPGRGTTFIIWLTNE